MALQNEKRFSPEKKIANIYIPQSKCLEMYA